MADLPAPPTRSAQILEFRRVAHQAAPTVSKTPVAPTSRVAGARLVYDVVRVDHSYWVSYQGTAIRKHALLGLAIENARLIAENFWAQGIPSVVRHIHDDGTIQPIAAFG